MSRKHLGMKRPVKQFEKATNEMNDYINSVNILPIRGEYAKEQAIKEWKTIINNVVVLLNNVKNMQIELIRGEKDESIH